MTTAMLVVLGIGLLIGAIPAAVYPRGRKAKVGIFVISFISFAITLWVITLLPYQYSSLYPFMLPFGPLLITIFALVKRGKKAKTIGACVAGAVILFYSYAALALHLSNASNALDGIAHLPTFLKGQGAVRDALNDPDSASFKGLSLRSYHDHPYMCGEVNARNRMGGLVGFTRFYVALDDVLPSPFFDNDTEHDSFNKYMRTCYGDDWDKG